MKRIPRFAATVNIWRAAILLLLLVLSACNYIRRDVTYGYPTEFRVESQVFIVCSDACRARAQCGSGERDGQQRYFVLLNEPEPATQNHNLIISHDARVVVREVRTEEMIGDASGSPFSMTYYNVFYDNPDGENIQGWVHGMCIADRSVNVE